jgi:hypothetical protein
MPSVNVASHRIRSKTFLSWRTAPAVVTYPPRPWINLRWRSPPFRLLEAVGFTGIVEVEFKTDSRDGQYKVLNVNPRVSVEQCRFVNAAKSPLDPRQPEADVRASAFH